MFPTTLPAMFIVADGWTIKTPGELIVTELLLRLTVEVPSAGITPVFVNAPPLDERAAVCASIVPEFVPVPDRLTAPPSASMVPEFIQFPATAITLPLSASIVPELVSAALSSSLPPLTA